jgi:hypothetical protein
MGYSVFGIDIYAKHESYENVIKLLFKDVKIYKDVTFYKVGERKSCKSDLEYNVIHYIPYDDYLIDGKKPKTIIVENDDQIYELLDQFNITFGPIQLVSSICNKVLGYVSDGDSHNISSEDMLTLFSLRNELFNQGRIKGNFFHGGDCCS